MDIDGLLNKSRWQLLALIAQQPQTPQELAKQSNTTTANISAQLRLLEAAQLVTRQRLRQRDAGQPRICYKLKPHQFFIAKIASQQAEKTYVTTSTVDDLIISCIMQQLPQRTFLFNYLLKHHAKIHNKAIGITYNNNTFTIGVIGEHDLPAVKNKDCSILVKSVSSLAGFLIKTGDYE